MAASDRPAPALEEPRGEPYGQLRSNARRREDPTMLLSGARGSSSLNSAGCLASARGQRFINSLMLDVPGKVRVAKMAKIPRP